MKIVNVKSLAGTAKEVRCPKGGFVSNRILLAADEMGYSLTKTIIPEGHWQYWHYRNHLETCYCIKGWGILHNTLTGDNYDIVEDVVYVLDKHDPHAFKAMEETVLICVFNPPLIGMETHDKNGSYVIA